MSVSKQLAAMAELIDTAPDRAGVDAQYRRACGFWEIGEVGEDWGGDDYDLDNAPRM